MVNMKVVAKPYARAAFDFAKEHNQLQQWSSLLKLFSNLIKDKSVEAIISNPNISQIEIVNFLKDELDENFYNFVALIAENKKLLIIPEISDQFELIKNVYDNVKVADVTLAYEVDKDTLSILQAKLEKRFGCNINMNVTVDPKIIGGAVIKVGDTVIDSSVSCYLENLRSVLLS